MKTKSTKTVGSSPEAKKGGSPTHLQLCMQKPLSLSHLHTGEGVFYPTVLIISLNSKIFCSKTHHQFNSSFGAGKATVTGIPKYISILEILIYENHASLA
jgi:hypothetical protein